MKGSMKQQTVYAQLRRLELEDADKTVDVRPYRRRKPGYGGERKRSINKARAQQLALDVLLHIAQNPFGFEDEELTNIIRDAVADLKKHGVGV